METIGVIFVSIGAFVGGCAFFAMLMDKRNPGPGYVLVACLVLVVIGGMLGAR